MHILPFYHFSSLVRRTSVIDFRPNIHLYILDLHLHITIYKPPLPRSMWVNEFSRKSLYIITYSNGLFYIFLGERTPMLDYIVLLFQCMVLSCSVHEWLSSFLLARAALTLKMHISYALSHYTGNILHATCRDMYIIFQHHIPGIYYS